MTDTSQIYSIRGPLGGYSQLRKLTRRVNIIVNLTLAILVAGGYSILSGAASSVTLGVVALFIAITVPLASFLQTRSVRRWQRRMIIALEGDVTPNASLLEAARRDILFLPWQMAALNIGIWILFVPAFKATLIFSGAVENSRFDPITPVLAALPAVICLNVLALYNSCEPFRTALFTGVDIRQYKSIGLLNARRRYVICLFLTAYQLVFCVVMVLQNVFISGDGTSLPQILPRLLLTYLATSMVIVVWAAKLALKSDPLELHSLNDPDAKQALAGAYEVQDQVGKGGMGTIHRAKHKLLGRTVAIKMIDSSLIADADAIKRFQREAQAASRLQHPNIVSVVDFGVLPGGRCFQVMEFVDGHTLSYRLARKGPVAWRDAVAIFISIGEALACAHDQGILHRDLKPSNVMLTEKDGTVKLVDFGLAKLINEKDPEGQLTKTGELFGTPLYMSPEQCSGSELDNRSDIYSMGCLMFEVLAGKPPFQGQTPLGTMYMQLNAPAPPLPESVGAPPVLRGILARALEKDKDERYKNMHELVHELKSLLGLASKQTVV